jgi:predicted permease
VQAVPGVESAAVVRALPFSGNGATANILLPDRPEPPRESPYLVRSNAITPTYFSTVRIPLLEGREFTASDGPDSPRVIIVSRSFVDTYWKGQSVIGRQVLVPPTFMSAQTVKRIPATIVGVVGDSKQFSLNERPLPQTYTPYAQDPFIFGSLAVRTKGDPLALSNSIRQAFWSIDKDQPMWKVRTLESMIGNSTRARREIVILLTCFSVLALFLAAIGLYGVLAFGVSQRTSEFGIRVAVGAAPSRILGLVMQRGLMLAALGIVIGIGGAIGLTRYIENQLFNVKPTDPAVYAVISLGLILIACAAMLIPARRAMRIDPLTALRQE